MLHYSTPVHPASRNTNEHPVMIYDCLTWVNKADMAILCNMELATEPHIAAAILSV